MSCTRRIKHSPNATLLIIGFVKLCQRKDLFPAMDGKASCAKSIPHRLFGLPQASGSICHGNRPWKPEGQWIQGLPTAKHAWLIHLFTRISSPFCFLTFVGFLLFSTNLAKDIYFLRGSYFQPSCFGPPKGENRRRERVSWPRELVKQCGWFLSLDHVTDRCGVVRLSLPWRPRGRDNFEAFDVLDVCGVC